MMNTKLSMKFMVEMRILLERHNRKAYGRSGEMLSNREASTQTREDRKKVLLLVFAQLKALGYPLASPYNLKEKHIEVLAKHWGEQGLGARTLHTRMSMLRVFSRWIGKPGMVKDTSDYFPDAQRISTATDNKAWEAHGLDPAEIIEQALALDKRFGIMLMLQKEFGLRVKETLELAPLKGVTPDGCHLMVVDGTKGGLPRLVPIRTEAQRHALSCAQVIVAKGKNKRMRWDGMTFEQSRNRFYDIMKKLGLTRGDKGVTAHGLRHGFAQARSRSITRQPTPIEGGKPKDVDPQLHAQAQQTVSLELGHRRKDVTNFYYGSHGHATRVPMTDLRRLQLWGFA